MKTRDWLFAFLLALPLASAASQIEEWVGMAFGEGTSEATLTVYIKIMLWFLVFAAMHASLQKSFKGHNRTSATIAFVASLIGVIYIPGEMILTIARAYSWIIAILLVALPFFYIWKAFGGKGKMPSGIMQSGMFLMVMAIILGVLSGYFLQVSTYPTRNQPLFQSLGSVTGVAAGVLFLLALIALLGKSHGEAKSEEGEHKESTEKKTYAERKKKKEEDLQDLKSLYGFIEQYRTTLSATILFGDRLLTENHAHRTAGGPPVNNTDWTHFNDAVQHLTTRIGDQKVMPLITKLAHTELKHGYNLLAGHFTALLNLLEQYQIEFTNKKLTGDAPGPRPPLPAMPTRADVGIT